MTARKPQNWSVHPGEIVREAVDESGDSARAFAGRLGIAPSYLSDICSGRRAISPLMALRLEWIGVGAAEMWVQLQASHDLFLERQRQDRQWQRVET